MQRLGGAGDGGTSTELTSRGKGEMGGKKEKRT